MKMKHDRTIKLDDGCHDMDMQGTVISYITAWAKASHQPTNSLSAAIPPRSHTSLFK